MKFSLQNKILIPVVLSLLILIGGSAFLLARFTTDYYEQNIVSMLVAGNDILSKNIRSSVATYRSVLQSVAVVPTLRRLVDSEESDNSMEFGLTKTSADVLKDFARIFPDFLQFNMVDASGNVIASSNRESVGTVNVADREYYKLALQGSDTVSAPLLSKSTGEKAVVFASPVKDFSNRINGVIYAVIPCTRIVFDTIQDVRMSRTGYAYIVDGKSGLMLAHNISDKIQTMDMFHYQPWMRDLKDGDHGIKKDYHDSTGKARFAVYRKDPVSGWIAVSCIATSEIESQETFLRNIIFLLTIGTAIFVSIVICCIIRPVTRDIITTSRYAANVADGNMESTLNVHRDDELGVLDDALRSMVNSLKGYVTREIKITERHRNHLAAMRDAMIITLADLVESRDSCTGQHIRKTAEYVRQIMDELQKNKVFPDEMTDRFVENVIRSAPLHDIGKIAVPDVILNKPGKLTDEEFTVMKTHAAAGADIIQRIIEITPESRYLSEAKNLAMSHHERWDGKGYPQGLAEEDIPLSARIMAVADVFDALTSERPYKKSFSVEKALAIIQEERGTHFDPRIVDAFICSMQSVSQQHA